MVEIFTEKALIATKALGIPTEEVIPILKKLLKMYDNDWTLIAEDNYRTLIDAYFEHKEDKGVVVKSRDPKAHDGSSQVPAKRKHLAGKEERKTPIIVESSEDSASEETEVPVGRKITEPTQLRMNDSRSESRYRKPRAQTIIKQEDSALSDVSPRDKRSKSLREVPATFDNNPVGEPSSSNAHRENLSSKLRKKGLPKPSTERLAIDLPFSRKPVSASKPGYSVTDYTGRSSSSSEYTNAHPVTLNEKKTFNLVDDITKGTEKIKISLVDEIGNESLPTFNYIPHSIIYQHANINISLSRIADEACCSRCSGNCLSSIPCACARETGGEFVYTPNGLLKEKFLRECLAMKKEPQVDRLVYCEDCPIEKAKTEYSTPEQCKGHLIRKFIKECWRKCGCDMKCGNRVVQRGISCKLQVFLTSEGKGWGLRTLDPLRRGTFVCEYVGEVLTNSELYDRNMGGSKRRHTYPVTLDADWGSEGILRDEEALCLDATYHGNVARFINHRCFDSNLVDIPVEVETPDRHYYHLAFFTTREVAAMEELTWDYGIDFDDITHPIEAFRCSCGSPNCRDKDSISKWT